MATLNSLNTQRKKAGQTALSKEDARVSTREASATSAQQAQTHQEQVLAGQNQITQQSRQNILADQNALKSSQILGTKDAAGNVVGAMDQYGNSTGASSQADYDARQSALNQRNANLTNSATNLNSQYGQGLGREDASILNQSANLGGRQSYDPVTGKSTALYDPRNPTGAGAPTGANVGDERNMDGNASMQGEAKRLAARKAGTPAGYTDTSKLVPSDGESPEQFRTRVNQTEQQNTELMKQEQIRNQKQPQGTQETPPTGKAAGSAAALANLPPGMEHLAPAFAAMQADLQKSQEENAKFTKDMQTKIDTTYGGVEEKMNEMMEGYKASTAAIQDILKEDADNTAHELALQEKRQDERLVWEDLKQRRSLSRQKAEMRDTIIAKNALFGGFTQDAGLQELMASDAEFESRFDELASELSYARTDVAAKFSALYMQNKQNYTKERVANLKDLRSSLERIGMQGISNDIARSNAEQSLLEKAFERDTQIRNEKSKLTYDYAKEMMNIILERERTKQADAKVELQYQRQQQDLDRREQTAYDREMRAEDRANTRADSAEVKNNRKIEIAESKTVRNEFKQVNESKTVEDYTAIRNATEKAKAVLQDAVANGGRLDKSIATEVTTVLYEKGLDPTSVVREGEYLRAALGQSIYDKGAKAIGMLFGGDTTGITSDMVSAMQNVMDSMSKSQKESAQAEYAGVINRLVDFNSRSEYENINPATLTLPSGITIPDWAVQSYFEDEEAAQNDTTWDVDWEDEGTWLSMTGTGQEMPGSPYHTGIDEYAIDVDGRIGDPLRSPATGTVVKVVRGDSGLGNYVVVEKKEGDDVYQYTLGHMDDIRVQKGDSIGAGLSLGTIGNSGNVIAGESGDGSHVHYRVTKNGVAYNPKKKRSIASAR